MSPANTALRHAPMAQAEVRDALRVLLVASEIYPLAKTGGLADVCAALPRALQGCGVDVRLLMPGYPSALDQLRSPQVFAQLPALLGVDDLRIISGEMPDSGLPVWLLDSKRLFGRPGSPYQAGDGHDWPDNALRFGVFCRAAAEIAFGAAGIDWQPHIVHCHDWHSGLVPLYLREAERAAPRSLITIHNASFQGNFPLSIAPQLGLPERLLTLDGVEFFGQLSFLKAGIRYADGITTVSPTYARELCTAEFGCGLEGLLRQRRDALVGVLNGIDTELWDPATDPHLAQHYSVSNRQGKERCKVELQQQLGLEANPQRPLATMVSRVTRQKMADIVLEQLPQLLEQHPDLQFGMLGQGDRDLEQGYVELAARFPGRVAARIGYDESDAHRMHAGADILVHGSRFEPCGLAQMYAMRYGSLPIVRRVGGLADSVVDADAKAADEAEPGNGFTFDEASGAALQSAVARTLDHYQRRRERWHHLQGQAMRADFGWQRSAQRYVEVFDRLLRGEPLQAAATGAAGNVTPLRAA